MFFFFFVHKACGILVPWPGIEKAPCIEGEVLTTVPPGKYLWDIFKPTIQTLLLFSHRHVRLFVTPWIVAHQTSLSFIISQSFLKLMSRDAIHPVFRNTAQEESSFQSITAHWQYTLVTQEHWWRCIMILMLVSCLLIQHSFCSP